MESRTGGKTFVVRTSDAQSEEIPQLYVNIIEIRNLPHRDNYGEFYCSAKLNLFQLQTSTQPIRSHNNAVKWPDPGEEFVFHVEKLEKSVLCIQIWNEAQTKNELIGEVIIPLNSLSNKSLITQYFPIQNPSGGSKSKSRGEIQLALYYTESISTAGALHKLQAQYVDFLTLLLDKDFAVVSALCDAVDVADADKIAPSLVRVFEYNSQTLPLLKHSIQKEVKLSVSNSVLFRSNSMAIKLVSYFARLIGSGYLKDALGPLMKMVCASPDHYEIDPERVSKGENISQNMIRLKDLAQRFFSKIYVEIDKCPLGIKQVCNYFKVIVEERFGEFWYTAVGSFFFLRYICPALIAPKAYDVLEENPSEKAQRVFVLISKILQNLANNREFKEDYMRDMNDFILTNAITINQLFESLSADVTPVDVDHRLSLSSIQILNDLYTLHKYLLSYSNKISQAMEDSNTEQQTQLPFNELLLILNRISADKEGMVKPYDIDSKELSEKGAMKILPPTFTKEQIFEEDMGILNVYPIWMEPARDLCVVANELLSKIYKIYLTHVRNSNEQSINWSAIAKSKEFKRFTEATCELQRVDLVNVSYPGRLTFWINIYNILMLHQHVILGPPDNLYRRRTFFSHCQYQIGTNYFSLNDIFNGVLRGNPKNLITRHRQFRGTDPRRAFVLPLDPRIHFAVGCLTQSSPFVRVYTAKTIEEELQRAGELYLKQHMEINLARKEIHLPRVLWTYETDFPKRKDDELFKWLFQFLLPKSRLDLLLLLEWGDFNVAFRSYHWSSQTKEETLKSDEIETAYSSGNAVDDVSRTMTHKSRRKTAVINERARRSAFQANLMMEQLQSHPILIPEKSQTREARSPLTEQSTEDETEEEVEEDVEDESDGSSVLPTVQSPNRLMGPLIEAIEVAIRTISNQLDWLNAHVKETIRIETFSDVSKFLKGIMKELEEFRGLESMQEVLSRRPSLAQKTVRFMPVSNSLSEDQKKAFPVERHLQFVKLINIVNAMVGDIKFINQSMLNKLKKTDAHSEILSTARLISKMKKSIEECTGTFGEKKEGKRKSEEQKQKAFQLTLVLQVKDLNEILQVIKTELIQHIENSALLDNQKDQALILALGKMLTFIHKQLSNINITLPPFQIDSSWQASSERDKQKIMALTERLPDVVQNSCKLLHQLTGNLLKEEVPNIFDVAIQLRNIREALSLVKGKKRKMADSSYKLVLRAHVRNSLKFKDTEELRVSLEKEMALRRSIESQLERSRDQISKLSTEVEKYKKENAAQKKAMEQLYQEIQQLKKAQQPPEKGIQRLRKSFLSSKSSSSVDLPTVPEEEEVALEAQLQKLLEASSPPQSPSPISKSEGSVHGLGGTTSVREKAMLWQSSSKSTSSDPKSI